VTGAGIVLPEFVFEAEGAATSAASLRYPLRHYKHCEYMGPNGPVRILANSFWSDGPAGEFSFNFTANLLPITDSGVPWVPLVQSMNLPGVADPLDWGSIARSHAAIHHYRLDRPFGETLAVFVYPPGMLSLAHSVSHAVHQWVRRRGTPQEESACAEGAVAARACCSWQEAEEDDDGS
jgi:hypothetical protein